MMLSITDLQTLDQSDTCGCCVVVFCNTNYFSYALAQVFIIYTETCVLDAALLLRDAAQALCSKQSYNGLAGVPVNV